MLPFSSSPSSVSITVSACMYLYNSGSRRCTPVVNPWMTKLVSTNESSGLRTARSIASTFASVMGCRIFPPLGVPSSQPDAVNRFWLAPNLLITDRISDARRGNDDPFGLLHPSYWVIGVPPHTLPCRGIAFSGWPFRHWPPAWTTNVQREVYECSGFVFHSVPFFLNEGPSCRSFGSDCYRKKGVRKTSPPAAFIGTCVYRKKGKRQKRRARLCIDKDAMTNLARALDYFEREMEQRQRIGLPRVVRFEHMQTVLGNLGMRNVSLERIIALSRERWKLCTSHGFRWVRDDTVDEETLFRIANHYWTDIEFDQRVIHNRLARSLPCQVSDLVFNHPVLPLKLDTQTHTPMPTQSGDLLRFLRRHPNRYHLDKETGCVSLVSHIDEGSTATQNRCGIDWYLSDDEVALSS
jgi:hypothetical protein